MADTTFLAGFTAEQADADIAAREASVDRLEATLRIAKDELKAAKAERKHLEEPAPGGDGVEAGAGAAEASGKAGS